MLRGKAAKKSKKPADIIDLFKTGQVFKPSYTGLLRLAGLN